MKELAIVTGAAKGIGVGIAQRFCEEGFLVVLISRGDDVYIQEKRLNEMGYNAVAFKCDITDKKAVKDTINEIISKYENITVLVNNAGVSGIKAFEDIDEDFLNRQINTNLKGTIYITQSVLPIMRKQMYGRIVMMSSVTGPFEADAGYSTYGMTKAGIIGLTKALAVEYAKYNITCNAICPGFILTPAVERSAHTTNPDNPEKVIEKIAKNVPMKRLGTPEEIGSLAVFLASKNAGYITGTSNIIDGGNIIPETGVMGVD